MLGCMPKMVIIMIQAYYEVNDEVNFGVKTNWIMDRVRAIDDLRNSIDNYNLTDLSLTWQPENADFSMSLFVKNIFDSDAREPTINNGPVVNVPFDLPMPGRTTLVQLTYHFN